MSPFQSAICLSLITAATLSAGEVAIEQRPFQVNARFSAKVMPENALLLQIDAEAWENFTIQTITPHGTPVVEGEVLIQFENEGIDRALEDLQLAIAKRELALAGAKKALAEIRETAPHRLDAARRKVAITMEQHAYFTQTERKAEEDSAAQQLERKKQWLENEKEELRQLSQMYEADDVTEDTEEIILIRQKNAVEAAEFALRMEMLQHQRMIGVLLPQKAVRLAHAERDAELALKYAETGIPLEIDQKHAELESLKSQQARDQHMLAELKHDRKLCTISAPSDGTFYHGPIQDGRWVTGDLTKSLVVSGQPPTGKPFACLIPKASPMVLVAFTDAATAQPLTDRTQGVVMLEGKDELDIPVQVAAVNTIPETNGRYRVTLNASWPQGFVPNAASPAEVHLITYHKSQAIAVPNDAIHFGIDGWSVELKLADGKTEQRAVKRGYRSAEKTEILSGLEAGQVIVTP